MCRLGVLIAPLIISEVGRCWDFKGLLIKGYWHGMMCAIVGGLQLGLTVYKPHLSDRESNESSLIQMFRESVVGGGKKLLATKHCWQPSKWIQARI